MSKNKHIVFYTDTDRYMGRKKANTVKSLEVKSWIESGNYIYFGGVKYSKIIKK